MNDMKKEVVVEKNETIEMIEEVLKDFFGAESRRYIDVSRIPLICQSIVGIDKRLHSIEENIVWGIRIVVGAILVALLALVIK